MTTHPAPPPPTPLCHPLNTASAGILPGSHHRGGLCPRVPVHMAIAIVFSLFRIHWLRVVHCLVFYIGSSVLGHEDRTQRWLASAYPLCTHAPSCCWEGSRSVWVLGDSSSSGNITIKINFPRQLCENHERDTLLASSR